MIQGLKKKPVDEPYAATVCVYVCEAPYLSILRVTACTVDPCWDSNCPLALKTSSLSVDRSPPTPAMLDTMILTGDPGISCFFWLQIARGRMT